MGFHWFQFLAMFISFALLLLVAYFVGWAFARGWRRGTRGGGPGTER